MVQLNAASSVVLAVVALNAANTLAAPMPARDVDELVAREPEPVKLPGVSAITHKISDAVKHHKAKPHHSTGTEKVNAAVDVGQLGVNLINAVKKPRSLDDEDFDLFAREDDEFDLYAREPEPLKLPGVGKVVSKVAKKVKGAVKHHKAKPNHSSKTEKVNTAVDAAQLGADAANAANQQRSFDEEESELFAREPLKLPGVGKVLSKVTGAAKNAVKHHKAKPHHSSKTEKVNTAVSVGQLGVDAVNAAKQQRSFDEEESELLAREPLKLPGVGKVLSKVTGAAKNAVKHHKAKPHHSSKTERVNTAVSVGQLGVDAVNAAKQQRSFDEEEFELFTREPLKLPGVGKVLSKVTGAAKNAVKHHKAKPHHSSKTEKVNTAVSVGQLGVDAVNAAKQQRSFDDDVSQLVARTKSKSSSTKAPAKAPASSKPKPATSKPNTHKPNTGKPKQTKPKTQKPKHHSTGTERVNTALEVGQFGLDVANTVNDIKNQQAPPPARREFYEYDMDMLD